MNRPAPSTADADQTARAARYLWAGRFAGVLSTHSVELPGYPFGSVVPYCLDGEGAPLLLLSHLSQHTRNLEADGRCSLTVAAGGEGDVQKLARLVAVGDIAPVAQEQGRRYLHYFPHGELYLRELGFRFFRLQPRRFHFNQGFATARWLGCERLLRRNPLSAEEEQAILEHMNRDHTDAIRSYFRRIGVSLSENKSAVRMAGLDGEGVDLARETDHGEDLRRLALPRPIAGRAEARDVLIEMARSG